MKNKIVIFVLIFCITLILSGVQGLYIQSSYIESLSEKNNFSSNSIHQLREFTDLEFNSTFHDIAEDAEKYIILNLFTDVTSPYERIEVPNPGESCEILSTLLQSLVLSELGMEKAIMLADSINSSKNYNAGLLLGFSTSGLFFESENISSFFSTPRMQFNFVLAYLEMFYATNNNMYLDWAQTIFQTANASFYKTLGIPGFVNKRITDMNGEFTDSILDQNVYSVYDQILALQTLRKLQYFSIDYETYLQYEYQILQIEELVLNFNYNFPTGGFALHSEFNSTDDTLSSSCLSRDSISYLLYLLGRSEEALNSGEHYNPAILADENDDLALEKAQLAFEVIKGINSAFKKNNRIVNNYNLETEEKSEWSYSGENLRYAYASLLYTQLINQYEVLISSPIGTTGNSIASDAYRILLAVEAAYNEEEGYFYSVWNDETRFSDLTAMGSLMTANNWVSIILPQLAPFKAKISFYPTTTIGENQTSFLTFDSIPIRRSNFAWSMGYNSNITAVHGLFGLVESINTQEEFTFSDITLNASLYSDVGSGAALINPTIVIANQMTKLGFNQLKYSIMKSGKEVFTFTTSINVQDRLFIEVKAPTSAIIPGSQVIIDVLVFNSAGIEMEDVNVKAEVILKQRTIFTQLDPLKKDLVINRTQTFSDFKIELFASKSLFTSDYYNTTIRIKELTIIEGAINFLTADSFGSMLSILGVSITAFFGINSIFLDRIRKVYRKCPHCGKKSYSKYPVCFNCGREVNKSNEIINLDN